MRLDELLGKHVRYAGQDGHIVEGECTSEAYVVIRLRTLGSAAPHLVRVPQSEWGEIELITQGAGEAGGATSPRRTGRG